MRQLFITCSKVLVFVRMERGMVISLRINAMILTVTDVLRKMIPAMKLVNL